MTERRARQVRAARLDAVVLGAKVRRPPERGLRRGRLDDVLDGLWRHRIGLVVAPAGSGKTTLLAQFAAEAPARVAWYRAETTDAELPAFLAYLHAALGPPAGRHGEPGPPWRSVEEAAAALEQRGDVRTLIVIDDVHCLAGTPAEAALARLVDYTPPELTFLLAARHLPGLNVSRLRVAGDVLELGADDLRFRTWEVERLFRECYEEPLNPEELAQVTQRTDGWAAGLQLFHLASRGKSQAERHRMIAALSGRSRLVGEYLTRNVLQDLSEELRNFLLDTCVLGWMSPALCDALLNRTESSLVLAELERRQIVSRGPGEREAYRCHEVLRSHLEAVLIERIGEAGARALFRRAGRLLEAAGRPTEALFAYCRGESWERAVRLLGHDGEQIAGAPGKWMDLLPGPLVNRDPWLLLAGARRCRATGRWTDAVDLYHRAERAFDDASRAEACRRERQALQCWTEPSPVPPAGWFGLLRVAVGRNPLAGASFTAGSAGVHHELTAGLSALVAGHVNTARALLSLVPESDGTTENLAAAARLAGAIAGLLAGDPRAERELTSAVEQADRLGLTWIARIGTAALALSGRADGLSEAVSARLLFEGRNDRWGASLATLLEGLGALRRFDRRPRLPELEAAGRAFREMGAGALASWCDCTRALLLARCGDPSARIEAGRAEAAGRATGVRAPLALATLALAETDPPHASDYLATAREIAAECGIELGTFAPSPAPAAAPLPPLTLRCLGRFTLALDGEVADLVPVKPRVRQLLRLLALHAGQPVHREAILEALWPETDPETGMRNLQVAISSLRQVVRSRNGVSFVERKEDAYLIALPPEADVDFLAFEGAVAAGDGARVRGDCGSAVAEYRRALGLYGGDLLAEVGPADWVVGERDRLRAQGTRAALALAELLLEAGDPAGAAEACERGLCLDRYRDALWRTLIGALQRAEGPAAAAVARSRYCEVLTELGVPPDHAQLEPA